MMAEPTIYLDYMATTPTDPRVVRAMLPYLTQDDAFGNPASRHFYGQKAKQAIDQAAQHVADLIHTTPDSIVWTSGATEANNLAIKGAAYQYQDQGRHIITVSTEHEAVLACCRELQGQGFDVTYLDPKPNGILDLSCLASAIRSDTVLISVMHVNSETGVIQPIQLIGEMARERGILFHVDAAQSAGKISIDLRTMPLDLLSLSAHKFYGPKGIGALFIRPNIKIRPQIHGGGQQKGLRSGTLATHQIVGMGEACRLANAEIYKEYEQLKKFGQRFCGAIAPLTGIRLHGDPEKRLPNCFNIAFDGVHSEALTTGLPHLAFSTTSACMAMKHTPSHVLRAMNVPKHVVDQSIRVSFGRFTTLEELDRAAFLITNEVTRLRKITNAII